MAGMRRHVTYANVIATVALFVALGGSAIAVGTLDGANIKRRSIPGNRLDKHVVGQQEIDRRVTVHAADVADLADRSRRAQLAGRALLADRAQVADRTSQLLVPGTQGGAAASGNLFRLSVGQTATLLNAPPFRVFATCTDYGENMYELEVSASSSEDGWRAGTAGPFAANERVPLGSFSSDHKDALSLNPDALLTPSGAALNLSEQTLAVHVFGDCAAALYAVS
jgi:hypothetical protein